MTNSIFILKGKVVVRVSQGKVNKFIENHKSDIVYHMGISTYDDTPGIVINGKPVDWNINSADGLEEFPAKLKELQEEKKMGDWRNEN
jgi:hypothetical protein